MAKSILDIVIRTLKEGGADKQVVKDLTAVKTTITSAMATFAAFAGVVYTADKVLDATVGTYVKYGQNVRDAQIALGLSVDETSRVIALTDDLGISYEDLSASIKKNADNTNYSINGLAAASERYLALGDAQDRAKFAQEQYGKQWQEFSKLLVKGPEQIRAMAAAVDEGHLFDDQDLQNIENYRIAQDRLHDSWEALAMTVGEALVPALTSVLDHTNDVNTATELAAQNGENFMWMTAKQKDYYLELAASQREATTAMKEQGAAAAGATVDYAGLLGIVQQLNDATAQEIKNIAYKQLQSDLAKSGNELTDQEGQLLREAGIQMGIFTEKSADNAEKIMDLNQQLEDGTLGLDKYIAALNRIPDAVNTNLIQTITTNSGTGVDGGLTSQAIGGEQIAGQPYLVHQDEVIVPATNGYTLTQTDARQILANSTGAGGGKNITIYGGVTVVAHGSVQSVLEELG